MNKDQKYIATAKGLFDFAELVKAWDLSSTTMGPIDDFLKEHKYFERTCTMSHRTFAGVDCYKCDECDDVSCATHAPSYCPNCGAKVVL